MNPKIPISAEIKYQAANLNRGEIYLCAPTAHEQKFYLNNTTSCVQSLLPWTLLRIFFYTYFAFTLQPLMQNNRNYFYIKFTHVNVCLIIRLFAAYIQTCFFSRGRLVAFSGHDQSCGVWMLYSFVQNSGYYVISIIIYYSL